MQTINSNATKLSLKKHRDNFDLMDLSKAEIARQLKCIKQTNTLLKSELEETKELFKTIVDSASTLIWMIDIKESFTFLNQSWLSFIGQTLEEGLKENWRDRIHADDVARCDQAYKSALNKCQGFQIEYRLRRFDDSYRTILNTAVIKLNPQGEFAGLLCSCLDITRRKKAEQQIIRQAHTDCILANITQKIHSSLDLDVILQTAIEQVNEYLLADKIFITKVVDSDRLILLFQQETAMSSNCCDMEVLNQLPVQQLIDNFERLSQGEIIASNNTSITEIMKVGYSDLPTELSSFLSIPVINNHKLWGVLCIEQQLPLRRWRLDEIELLERVAIQLGIAINQSELYQQLETLSIVDGLTKIANRRKFDQYLLAEWKRLSREKKSLSLIICDVDYFKLYNDTYGHQAGDICLKNIAQAISKAVKRPADLVARYGGEEFAIILPNTDIDGAKHLAQQVRLQIASLKIPHINSPIDLYATLSFGIGSCVPDSEISHNDLISATDQALYNAKESGRDCIVIKSTVQT